MTQTNNASTARGTQDSKNETLQTSAIRRRLEKHARSCAYYIFSGDRHCSCGRDQALQELEAIERALGMEYDRKL